MDANLAIMGLLGTLLAGLGGAWIGGRLAIAAARAAAEKAQHLRDQRARASLAGRLLFMAQGTQTIGSALHNSDPNSGTALGAMRELFAMWEPFDSMAADLHLLGDLELERDAFVLCYEARILSRNLIRMEAIAERNTLAADSGSQRALERLEREAMPITRVRDGVRTAGPGMANRAQALADRLQSLARQTRQASPSGPNR